MTTATAPSAIDAVTFEQLGPSGFTFDVLLDGRPMGCVTQDGSEWIGWFLDGRTIGARDDHSRFGNGGERFDSREAAAEALL